ncbi:MAG TPA: autotransporter-associated beta strand repeat-containing protein, partial [Gammaproteobacteria bacterium]|nr:autotransporter-associated beta strand repeat-containing protein [Gammaproteobacteria bacterium]
GAITLAGGSRINSDANTLTLTGGIVGTGQGLTVGGSGNTTISTTGINTSTAGTLTKDGSGVLLLNATNNYTGATTINAGKLQLGASDRIADSSDVVLADVLNTVFDLNSFSEIIANLTGGGTTGGNITLGAGTLTVTQSSNGTYAGVMSGSGGFTKAGSNILTLSGINTYTGATTINAGTLRLGIANAIASNSAVSLADVASAVFDLNNFSQTIGTLSGGGSTGGNINLGNGAFTVTQAINGTYAGVMSGSGAFTKAGSGILTLSGANTYTGLTSINAGAIEITNNASLGTSAGATTIASGAALQINTSGLTISDAMSIAGTGLSGNGVIRNMSGTNIFSGTMTLSSASTINVDAGSLTFSNNITGTGNTITFNGAGNTTLSSALNTGASAGLVKNGTGTLTLSAANTYTGATNINSGKISVLNAGALGTSSSTTIASNAALDIGVSSLTNTNTINLNGTGISNAGALVLSANNTTINNQLVLQSDSTIGSTNSGTMTFGGAITGANTALTINLANADVVLPAVTLNSDLTIQSNSTSIGNGITLAIAGAFTVSNNTSFTNNGTINAGSFTLSGANNILLGTSTLNTTGAVNITGGNATGRTNALSLFINLNTANLIGTIDGATGEAAALKVAFVGSTLNTLFFNGFDLVLLHTPPAPPAPTPTPDVFVPVVPITAFDTLPGLIASYNNVNNTPTTQTVPLNSVASYTNTASGLINLDIPTGSSSFFDTTILGSSPFLGVSLQGANTGEISDFLGLQ